MDHFSLLFICFVWLIRSAYAHSAGPRFLENGLLDYEQKVISCTLSKIANAAFVKTSTGFGHGGATVEDITLMRNIVGPEMGVKASGGVRSAEDVKNMLDAGATRIGASASIEIVSGKKSSGGKARNGGY